mmetsp:Transcript_13639/g.24703  ORF Transcript_13639/g.24703 Transcript_13639/m.24703 type:complete len:103 (+) Transcript_13639:104-412(+)
MTWKCTNGFTKIRLKILPNLRGRLSVDCFKTLRCPCRHNELDVLIVYYYTHDCIGNILAFASVFFFLWPNPVQAGSGSNTQLTHPHFVSTNTQVVLALLKLL